MVKQLSLHRLRVKAGKQWLNLPHQLNIEPGQIWGILGCNGSGKTSLLHCMAGLSAPVSGSIWLNQQPLSDYPLTKKAQQIGILFQHQQDAFPCSVYDTVSLGRYPYQSSWHHHDPVSRDKIEFCLEMMDLVALRHKNIQHLSGGERQRVAIASLLSQDPVFYCLDEPFNHLDMVYQQKLIQHLQQIARTQHKAMLINMHDMNLAWQLCDQIITIDKNGEVYYGTKQQLMTPKHLSKIFAYPIAKQQQFFYATLTESARLDACLAD